MEPRLAARARGLRGYRVPATTQVLDLDLRGNEGALPDPALLTALGDPAILRRYPDARAVEAALAARLGLDPSQILVTAGGDDALDRICRLTLEPGRRALLPTPGFEMTERYVALAGGERVDLPWTGEFPLAETLAAIDDRTGLLVLTSPNNPTGLTVTADARRRLIAACAAVGAVVLLDLAYVEFAAEDPTIEAAAEPNVLIVRTLSKAWGLAGLRVGYVVGPPALLEPLRAMGAPYAVAGPSLTIAAAALAADGEGTTLGRFVAETREARAALEASLRIAGLEPSPSEANFAFAEGDRAGWVVDAAASLGVGVRRFPGRPGLERAVRVGCPPDAEGLRRACLALETAGRPEAILFDMDGVLVDVSQSYRAAIQGTAAEFGVAVTSEQIRAMKAKGDANNDWIVTMRLLREAGVEVPLDQVTACFEALYQGTAERPGLKTTERLLPPRALLERLAARLPLAVVTGRPRRDAVEALERHDLLAFFPVVVCMEDGPAKPNPAPVTLALRRLGLGRAWLVGDTPDDLRAARAAGVVPIGIRAPGDTDPTALLTAGAARVLAALTDLETLLP
jgi:histidinol-phosphate aminotransferase